MAINFYSERYFQYQKKIGLDNKKIVNRFSKYINSKDSVLDFGCGGGFLLKEINCINKIGYDINPHAIEFAKSNNIKVVDSLDFISENSLDVIISNSVIAHLDDPFETLIHLKKFLKKNGKIIFSTPHETINWKYSEGEVNNKLYTWSPMALGNLFKQAGYVVLKVDIHKEISLPMENIYYNYLPKSFIKTLRKIYRLLRLVLDEINLKRIGVDGNIIVVANNP